MAFFEQLGKKLSDAGQGVAQQTKNFAEVTRLSSAISDKEKQITQLYQSIGQAYYQSHKDDTAAEFQAETDQIKALMKEINQHQEEIKQIKGVVKCPSCGADVPFQAAFCNCCGMKMAPSAPPAQPPAPGTRLCPNCGTALGKDKLFCTHCGTKLEAKENQEG